MYRPLARTLNNLNGEKSGKRDNGLSQGAGIGSTRRQRLSCDEVVAGEPAALVRSRAIKAVSVCFRMSYEISDDGSKLQEARARQGEKAVVAVEEGSGEQEEEGGGGGGAGAAAAAAAASKIKGEPSPSLTVARWLYVVGAYDECMALLAGEDGGRLTCGGGGEGWEGRGGGGGGAVGKLMSKCRAKVLEGVKEEVP